MMVYRLASNMLDVDGLKVFRVDGDWKAVNKKPLTRKQKQYILAFLEEEEIAQQRCFNIKTDLLLFEIIYKHQVKRNEWHFISKVLKSLETTNEVLFDVIDKTYSNPYLDFEGVIKDENGTIYYLMESESTIMFNELLFKHNLTIQEEHLKRQIIVSSDQSGQLFFDFDSINK